jgi:hypothetical protein
MGQPENTKHQTPNTKEPPNFNFQTPNTQKPFAERDVCAMQRARPAIPKSNGKLEFGVLLWSLDFGA